MPSLAFAQAILFRSTVFKRMWSLRPSAAGQLAMVLFFVMATLGPATVPTLLRAEDGPLDGYTEQTYVDPAGKSHRYRLLFPAGYDANDNKQYPLVLLLHGAGERGDDNRAQLVHGAAEFARADRQAEYPCWVVVPQVPKGEKWVDADWSLSEGRGSFPNEHSPAYAAAIGMVQTWIESGRVDPQRIYVTGLSMGGYGTWYAASASKEIFAAAVPICGGGDASWADRYEGMPIWAFHGSEDGAVPVIRSREMIKVLEEAGQTPEPIYTEYEGGGHDVWTQTYRRDDLFRWLFSQKRSAS
jgi:predicted peptidase